MANSKRLLSRDHISDWSLTERITVTIHVGIALSMLYLLFFG